MNDHVYGFLVGASVAVVAPFILFLMQEIIKDRRQRKSVTAAIVSEISSIVHLVERRNYIPEMKRIIDLAKKNGPGPNAIGFTFSARRNYLAVYDANLVNIGLLKPSLAKKVVFFYAQVSAALEDIQDMGEGKYNRPHEVSLVCLTTLVALFEDTLILGKEIIKEARY